MQENVGIPLQKMHFLRNLHLCQQQVILNQIETVF